MTVSAVPTDDHFDLTDGQRRGGSSSQRLADLEFPDGAVSDLGLPAG